MKQLIKLPKVSAKNVKALALSFAVVAIILGPRVAYLARGVATDLNGTVAPSAINEIAQNATKQLNSPQQADKDTTSNSEQPDDAANNIGNSSAVDEDLRQAAAYQESADKAAAGAAELRRCNDINSTAYSTYTSKKAGAYNLLYNYQIPTLNANRDNGTISFDEYDEGMRQFYSQYNTTVSSAFNEYTNTIRSQNCEPSITVAPTPLTWNF